jgi:hypothetical protein
LDFSTVCYEFYKTAAASHEIIESLRGGGWSFCTRVLGRNNLLTDTSLPDLDSGWGWTRSSWGVMGEGEEALG